MLTPRQHNQASGAIKKHGLAEDSFAITITEKEAKISHHETGFYFAFSSFSDVTASVANAIMVTLFPFYVEYTPSLVRTKLNKITPVKYGADNWDSAMRHLNNWLAWIKKEYGPFETVKTTDSLNIASTAISSPLSHLHPSVQQAINSRFASGHYSDAVEKACLALEIEVRKKTSQPKDLGGTDLMNRVFSQANPLLTLSTDRGEREGYMFLFRGMWQALRSHHAHNDTTTDPARALEWLSFVSALFYKLDEAQLTTAPPAP